MSHTGTWSRSGHRNLLKFRRRTHCLDPCVHPMQLAGSDHCRSRPVHCYQCTGCDVGSADFGWVVQPGSAEALADDFWSEHGILLYVLPHTLYPIVLPCAVILVGTTARRHGPSWLLERTTTLNLKTQVREARSMHSTSHSAQNRLAIVTATCNRRRPRTTLARPCTRSNGGRYRHSACG